MLSTLVEIFTSFLSLQGHTEFAHLIDGQSEGRASGHGRAMACGVHSMLQGLESRAEEASVGTKGGECRYGGAGHGPPG